MSHWSAIARLKLGKVGQPPANKVLIRHGPSASMGASRLGHQLDKWIDNIKLECQDHMSLLIKRSPTGNVFSSASCRQNRPDSVFVHRGSNQQQEIKTFAVL